MLYVLFLLLVFLIFYSAFVNKNDAENHKKASENCEKKLKNQPFLLLFCNGCAMLLLMLRLSSERGLVGVALCLVLLTNMLFIIQQMRRPSFKFQQAVWGSPSLVCSICS